MSNFNKVILMGTLTRDPELRATPKGSSVCQFSIAVNRNWKDDTGQKKEEALFCDIAAFGRTADVIAEHCRKGSKLLVEGRLRQEVWTDKTSQQKRSKLSVVVENFQFIGTKAEKSESTPAPASAPAEDDDSNSVPF